MVNRSQGADNRPRLGSTVAQLWRSKLPAIVTARVRELERAAAPAASTSSPVAPRAATFLRQARDRDRGRVTPGAGGRVIQMSP